MSSANEAMPYLPSPGKLKDEEKKVGDEPELSPTAVANLKMALPYKPDQSNSARVFYVGEHPVDGVGRALYARHFIPKGSYILTFCGPLVTDEEATKRDMANFGRIMGNELQIGPDFYVYLEEPGRLINHSCDPNAGIVDDTIVVAAKDIHEDEQICFDYSTTMDEGEIWQMECSCGASKCRGFAADFKTLPKGVRRGYLQSGFVQTFIKRQYDASTGEMLEEEA